VTSILGSEKLAAIRKVLAKLDDVPGVAAECGVYKGGTLRMIAETCPDRPVYGFDTFTGLPGEMWRAGEPHGVGDFRDTTLDDVRTVVAGLANVELVPGVFPASAAPLADLRFAFVHLDLDWYRSTRDALEWLLPRMSKGAAIVFDDYEWKHCPGVKQAIDGLELAVERTVPFQVVHWVGR
jgi:hypothetical protein